MSFVAFDQKVLKPYKAETPAAKANLQTFFPRFGCLRPFVRSLTAVQKERLELAFQRSMGNKSSVPFRRTSISCTAATAGTVKITQIVNQTAGIGWTSSPIPYPSRPSPGEPIRSSSPAITTIQTSSANGRRDGSGRIVRIKREGSGKMKFRRDLAFVLTALLFSFAFLLFSEMGDFAPGLPVPPAETRCFRRAERRRQGRASGPRTRGIDGRLDGQNLRLHQAGRTAACSPVLSGIKEVR